MKYSDITLVVASYNSEQALAKTLPRNLELGFGKIVIIDGFSTDGTHSIVSKLNLKYPDRVCFHQQAKKGLANARNVGTALCKTTYVMHGGPDNIFEHDTVDIMLKALEKNDLVSCQTFLENNVGYWNKAHNLYKRRFAVGYQSVVGTPYLARRNLFEAYPFDEAMLNSDDTELCHRLIAGGKIIYRTEAICFESGFHTLMDFWERWPRWGRGDSLFYNKMKCSWTWLRRGKSLLHPLVVELIKPGAYMKAWQYAYCFPFLCLVCSFRYFGWVRHVISGK